MNGGIINSITRLHLVGSTEIDRDRFMEINRSRKMLHLVGCTLEVTQTCYFDTFHYFQYFFLDF